MKKHQFDIINLGYGIQGVMRRSAKFATHLAEYEYNVYEVSTGIRMAGGITPEDAIKETKRRIQQIGILKTKELIREGAKKSRFL